MGTLALVRRQRRDMQGGGGGLALPENSENSSILRCNLVQSGCLN